MKQKIRSIKLILLSILFSKETGYKITILGISLNGNERSLGIGIFKENQPTSKYTSINVIIFAYGYVKEFKLSKRLKKNYYVCNTCKNVVTPINKFCKECDEYLLDYETTMIDLKELEKRLDDALAKETKKSLTKWIIGKRKTSK